MTYSNALVQAVATTLNPFPLFLHRMMSSMRATPPFHPPSEEEEAMGQDSTAWASEEREGPKETPSPSSHDRPHPDELQPLREKLTEAEWENVVPAAMVRSELHTELRN